MYLSFDLPENVMNQFRPGRLTGEKFEEVLFNRFLCRTKTTIMFNTIDPNNRNPSVVSIEFQDYGMIKRPSLSLGPSYKNVLGRGFDRYPRFDDM